MSSPWVQGFRDMVRCLRADVQDSLTHPDAGAAERALCIAVVACCDSYFQQTLRETITGEGTEGEAPILPSDLRWPRG